MLNFRVIKAQRVNILYLKLIYNGKNQLFKYLEHYKQRSLYNFL